MPLFLFPSLLGCCHGKAMNIHEESATRLARWADSRRVPEVRPSKHTLAVCLKRSGAQWCCRDTSESSPRQRGSGTQMDVGVSFDSGPKPLRNSSFFRFQCILKGSSHMTTRVMVAIDRANSFSGTHLLRWKEITCGQNFKSSVREWPSPDVRRTGQVRGVEAGGQEHRAWTTRLWSVTASRRQTCANGQGMHGKSMRRLSMKEKRQHRGNNAVNLPTLSSKSLCSYCGCTTERHI